MATPYLVYREEEATSTQDRAGDLLEELPVLVVAARQTRGRGRGGAEWLTAPRALAASVATRVDGDDPRPFSLMAGVAALRALGGAVGLKWPNDVMKGEAKLGGILVERSDRLMLIGFGLNLWWPRAPEGVGALFDQDPGSECHAELGGLWAAELFRLLEAKGWPHDEYVAACLTLGRDIVWEPGGEGRAVGIAPDGSLVVERGGRRLTLSSGAVRHVRG